MRLGPATVAAIVLLLAGCGSPLGGQTPTVTPAPVPDDERSYPPGVHGTGAVAPSVLLDAHQASLADVSFTVETRQVLRRDGTVVRRTVHDRWVAPNRSVYHVRYAQLPETLGDARQQVDVEYWSNGSVWAGRYDDGTRVTTRLMRDPDDPKRGTLTGRDAIEDHMRAFDVRASTDRDVGVVVSGDQIVRPGSLHAPVRSTEYRNGTYFARVSPEGTVLFARVSYDATMENRTVRVERVTRVKDVGSTDVERPSWLSEAIPATTV